MIISPQFFNIEKFIIEEFKNRGYEVIWYDERINNNKLFKIALRKNSKWIKPILDGYYKKIYNRIIEENIIELLIIKAESVPTWFLSKLKLNIEEIKILHYMYDPISNYQTILPKLEYFTECLTFDSRDSEIMNWIHRPLFFPPTINLKYNENGKHIYFMSFIGTLHSDRATIIHKILNEIGEEQQQNSFIYYYISLKTMFLYEKIFKKNFRMLQLKDINTTALSHEETLHIMNNSKIIIDIHHDSQSGLTNRTLEALALNKRIITTNPYIKKYDFYSENNVLVVNKDNVSIPKDWLDMSHEYIEYDISYFSIKSFVQEFIDLFNKEEY